MSQILYQQMARALRQLTTKSKIQNGLLYSGHSYITDHVTIYNCYY